MPGISHVVTATLIAGARRRAGAYHARVAQRRRSGHPSHPSPRHHAGCFRRECRRLRENEEVLDCVRLTGDPRGTLHTSVPNGSAASTLTSSSSHPERGRCRVAAPPRTMPVSRVVCWAAVPQREVQFRDPLDVPSAGRQRGSQASRSIGSRGRDSLFVAPASVSTASGPPTTVEATPPLVHDLGGPQERAQ